ncbi:MULTISPECIES: hypothetical protein [unclassified Pseudoalteromonas]|uniref:hypothetical protein n=1 Tax=unclassified Pseudoalteromonas TaxID=194690 RepID=UPI003014E46C
MSYKVQQGVFFTLLLTCFLSVFYLAQSSNIDKAIAQTEQSISLRVAIDLRRLAIADPLFNYAGNEAQLNTYIIALNDELTKQGSRLTVNNISATKSANSKEQQLRLSGPYKDYYITVTADRQLALSTFIFPLVLALLVFFAYRWFDRKTYVAAKRAQKSAATAPEFQLVVDLFNKVVTNNHDKSRQVQLANKPLCFYLAIVEFCEHHPEVVLNQNKDMPEELIEIANKYFYRLIELGHTIRKRPDFTNSLEKTLSEIRAALDEVLAPFPEQKARYYPPKAHGEGSRSKLHSYGLNNVKKSDIEIIGK